MIFDVEINPNEDKLKEITEAVYANGGYCPCAITKDEDTKCMCKSFRDSEDVDFCHCGRFYKIRDYENLAVIGDLSEEYTKEIYINWCEKLNYQDFIVMGIPLNPYDYHLNENKTLNLYKSIIAKSDAVLIITQNKELQNIIDILLQWAIEINKKIVTMEDLLK